MMMIATMTLMVFACVAISGNRKCKAQLISYGGLLVKDTVRFFSSAESDAEVITAVALLLLTEQR